MACFPLCMNLKGKTVLLVGSGPQIQEKSERLAPFCADLIRLDRLTARDLAQRPALVVAGDLPENEAEQVFQLCAARHIPVNVVDMPRFCTFTVPAMVVQGDVTIAISTGGKAPGAAAYLKEQIARLLPEKTEDILDWLAGVRADLRQTHEPADRARLLRALTEAAFSKGDILSMEEYQRITDQ